MSEQFDYERVLQLCTRLGARATPAMIHGTIAGHLCAGGRFMAEQFIAQALEVMETDQSADPETKAELIEFYDNMLAVLQDEQMLFRPVFVADGQEIPRRLSELASWCSAFISGLGLSGRDLSKMTPEAGEIISDLSEISLLQEQDADDSDEEDWMTVFEHVRLSALSLFLEFNELPKTEASDNTTH
ncbi:UPF0149 family protein [Gynuella sunshinyii]|uniref:YecA family protein n=1 Tax=Gynuella sunshinyii YC6258 TaxID=1445510 RepID=A0A0C5VJG3_9GAMM|nr:UPF0149 family protein [Gynuella sunshinyii]AJQ93543.1 hypothetical protein YC6258_01495 [Gynuella sunshinyii YC6258]